ncbi:hypothetical protein KVR01_009194 [Diaporthe batatas]|uniref:uncharacterized protein n=1 Tax=Diaporthe batatas TaxID=748121 RepID=UPI001D048DEA|nr:uncharacterized protein KVR01_009194 [Diaporthe batatas]KAG8160930.1 hypothetical protein KVR01_009194 [Diaporthe batatas]
MADQANSTLGSHQHQEGGSSPAEGNTTLVSTPKGGNIRHSQYAEAIANPLPELAVTPEEEGTELETFPRLSEIEFDVSGCSTRAVVEPDDLSDHRSAAVVYVGEKPSVWRKYRTAFIITLVLLVLGLTGTIVGVVSSFRVLISIEVVIVLDGLFPLCIPYPVPLAGASSWQPSQVVPLLHARIPPQLPFNVPTPSQCADASGFLTSVSFMGVQGGPSNGGWKTAYCGSASNAKDCCACCFRNKDGCNSWAYYASSGFAGTRCALIVGWDTGDGKDSTCPAGHDATVYFSTESDDSSDAGAPGPCGIMAD